MSSDRDELQKEKMWYKKIEIIEKEIKALRKEKRQIEKKEEEYREFKLSINAIKNAADSTSTDVRSAGSIFLKNIKTNRNRSTISNFTKASNYLSGISSGINKSIIPAIENERKKLKRIKTVTEKKLEVKKKQLRAVSSHII